MRRASGSQRHGQDAVAAATITGYVLGLADGFRGADLLAQLAQFSIPARIVPGVDAATLTPDQLRSIYDPGAAEWIERVLAPAEAACTLGHLRMMRAFLRTDSEWAIFLEDDATLLRDPAMLVAALAGAPRSPTVVHLSAMVPQRSGARCVMRADHCRIWAVGSPVDGSAGYAANRALALLATEAYRDHRVDSVADWPIRWRYDAHFVVCEPQIVGHQRSESSIESGRVVAQAGGIRDKRSRLARLVATVCGPRLIAARQYGYPITLVIRHNVVAPVTRVVRRRWLGRRRA